MKHTYMLLPALALLFASCGRNAQMEIGELRNVDAKERTITVTGSSETFMVPDDISLLIELKEYDEGGSRSRTYRDKDTTKLIHMSKIEREVTSKLVKLGVSNDRIKIKNTNATWEYNWEWYHSYRTPVYVNKTLEVKFSDINEVPRIIEQLQMTGVEHVYLGTLRCTKEREMRRQVKIDALKAAKEKATYLLEALGAKPGDIITVEESPAENAQQQYPYYYWWNSPYGLGNNNVSNSVSNSSVGSNSAGDAAAGDPGSASGQRENPRDIKMKYEVKVTFEIVQ